MDDTIGRADEKIEALMVGFESVGKSGLFQEMTGDKRALPQNIKGSTVSALKGQCQLNSLIQLIDLPGLQVDIDSKNMQTSLSYLQSSKTLLLIVKATTLKKELIRLHESLRLKGYEVGVIATHSDKYTPSEFEQVRIQELLQVPVAWINTRKITKETQEITLQCILQAKPWGASKSILAFLPDSQEESPKLLPVFRYPIIGAIVACFTIFMVFAVPVIISHLFTSWFEPIVDQLLLDPLIASLAATPNFLRDLLVGDYGLITLGVYSFLWAFPVVFMMSIMTSLLEETGLQEHLTTTLDPWLRKMGLTGRDLLPVITGFGCNVVAVFQSRGCSSCTRKSCVSLIAFGSACSYQIGATLSIFNAAKVPFLFVPYLGVLFLVGAVHTRIWNPVGEIELTRVAELPYIQEINWRTFWWKIIGSNKQFLFQAMPIFLSICLAASILQKVHLLNIFNYLAIPILKLFSLPVEAAPSLIFSLIRKDGLLILNEGKGHLLAKMTTPQIFILVYLASTLSACLVTILSIRKELGLRTALSIMGQQLATSILSTIVLALIIR